MSIAIGDQPEYGSAYRGGEGLAICGEGHVFGRCEQAGCAIDHLLICTAPKGHLGGDVPHVACGASYGVVGIWDGRGQVLGYLADNSDRRLANAGVTLR